ncbi:MAG TPA: tetratricopeptide repeat protein [Chloroflexia bacterium]|nr:tetratricopeptide repeat protein [Chloroflexia bacterium]
MKEPPLFADLLKQHVTRTWHTPGQLANLSGLPKATIVNWMEGRVSKPRYRFDLIKLAAALHLDAWSANELLQSAGYPSLAELRGLADEEEKSLLATWDSALLESGRAPFQAIADLPYFVGREQILHDIARLLSTSHPNKIVCLHGMAGVGKTVLAARLAYLLRPSFPDGVLWAQLDAADTMSIISIFTNAYGRDVGRYTDVQSRSAILREVLSNKRTLLILDNALNSEQVEPLLPPTGGCAVIITTRYHNLRVAAGLPNFEIGPFDSATGEAIELFARIVGDESVQAEKGSLEEIIARLGHLPLAIAITASRLSQEPDRSASDLLARLDRGPRLNELVYDNWNVRLSLQPSYDALPLEQQRFFSSLGVFGSNDFSVEATAALNDVPVEEAAETLRRLYFLSLVQQARATRYRLHPLLSDFARETITTSLVYSRMPEYFIRYAEEHIDDYMALDLELSNILQGLRIADERELPGLLVRGVSVIYPFLEKRGLYALAIEYLQRARQAAESLGDNEALAVTLLNLGRSRARTGDNAQAEVLLQEGISLARRIDSPRLVCDLLLDLGATTVNMSRYKEGEQYFLECLALANEIGYYKKAGVALMFLGIIERRYANYEKAADYFRRGLHLAREAGDADTIIRILTSLSGIAGLLNEYDRAGRYIEEGLDMADATGDREASLGLLINAGCLAFVRGNLEQAEVYLCQGLNMAREMGNLNRVNYFLLNLADVVIKQGKNDAADKYYQEALIVSRQVGEAWMISNTLVSMGQFYLKLNSAGTADALFSEAYELARKLNLAEIGADALFGMAQVALARDNFGQAYSYGEQSLATYRAIIKDGAKEQAVQEWLAAFAQPQVAFSPGTSRV